MSECDFIYTGKATNGRPGSGSRAVAVRRPESRCDSGAGRPAFARCGGTGWGAFLCVAYPVLAVAPLVAVHALGRSGGPTATALGVNCALVGFTLLSLQFVLASRLSWIEAPFGLDLVLRFHRVMALVIVALLCAHPVLLAGPRGWRLLIRLHARWYIWAGRVALVLLAVQVAAALLRGAMCLSYERWRRAHNVVAVALLALGFVHAVMAGEDLKDAGGLLLWAVSPALGLAAWLYSRGIRPQLLARRAFRVHSVRLEAPGVWTVTLDDVAGRAFHFSPGQFQFLRLLDSDVPAEEHPFSIASSPSWPGRISLTIKRCGNFTSLIDRVRAGDRQTVHGPFGRFSHDLHPGEGHLVFIAGGVGITPLMSMLRAMRDRGEARRVTLIHAGRGPDDMLFAQELGAMAAGPWPDLQVIRVLSQPPPWWAGETGRVDADRLDEWCGGLEHKAFYVCCPPRMNAELIRGLLRRGVSRRRIHCDAFSL